MKKLFAVLIVVALCFGVVGCESDSSDKKMQKQSEKSMDEMHKQTGLPNMVNFQERKLMKMILELRDQENLITYAYIVNHMTGELVFIGKCTGYGLPYSVQYTNPQKLVDRYGGRVGSIEDAFILPQADPNGLFMPGGLSATWLMMIDPETNEARPVYVEPEIIVSPFPLHK